MWLQFQCRFAQSQNFVHTKIIMKFKYDGWPKKVMISYVIEYNLKIVWFNIILK